ncbi:MAG: bifunctional (p)ppGpp synthetase/guanosine-3',5'-bis(diphosphate) 3'-pyrophosphohydrolase [Nitrosomonadales bacterium]|nr:bifunctional (p)ppGpp synthetase/guanosine-3',5'-bis(diphosphate) 3'-pyrophosphohydrolase [Nitrosomonadales bacterium]
MVLTDKNSVSPADIRIRLDALAANFAPAEGALIRRACELAEPLYAGQVELTGTPLLQHAFGAAAILVGMHMDHETIAATLLHAAPDYLDDWPEKIEKDFGHNVKMLVDGISRMEHIRQFSEMPSQHKKGKDKDDAAQQIESLRKMLLAMVQDIRVVLIKLAERTQTLRYLSGADKDQQKLIARETRSLFAPLANRLGVWQLKWELEDLSVRYLEPELYRNVARLLDERRVDRERYIAEVVARLRQTLAGAGVPAEVTGRPKHIYSIINKMKRKQIEFGELYDVRAVRILVGGKASPDVDHGAGVPPPAPSRNRLLRSNVSEADIQNCYAALSVVHELWEPIASEFDDYIANPKGNGYRSLHTAVIGPRGLALEVQIRTREMHQHSELGVAAHWRYKENKKSDAGFDEKIAWLRQILEWKEELADKGELQEQFKNELFHDQVYMLTPQGKVIALPKGATPVDFAYALHTDLGHRTRGAKVDGSIAPLSYKLQNGSRVEILTAKQGGPSRDWLAPSLGFLQSSSARAKVRAWFRSRNYDESIAQGRTQLDRDLHRLGVTSINQEKLAQRLHFNKLDDLLAAIGRNEITAHRIAVAIQEELPTKVIEIARPAAYRPSTQRTQNADITVGGVNNLMTRIAKCCNPVTGDPIVGYVTRDRGITIHREDCAFMLHLMESRQDRKLTARWEA